MIAKVASCLILLSMVAETRKCRHGRGAGNLCFRVRMFVIAELL